MSTVDVTYTVLVVVRVDTETGKVERVQVDDENARLDEDRERAKAGAHEPDRELWQAIEIAEDPGTEWPAWEFGF